MINENNTNIEEDNDTISTERDVCSLHPNNSNGPETLFTTKEYEDKYVNNLSPYLSLHYTYKKNDDFQTIFINLALQIDIYFTNRRELHNKLKRLGYSNKFIFSPKVCKLTQENLKEMYMGADKGYLHDFNLFVFPYGDDNNDDLILCHHGRTESKLWMMLFLSFVDVYGSPFYFYDPMISALNRVIWHTEFLSELYDKILLVSQDKHIHGVNDIILRSRANLLYGSLEDKKADVICLCVINKVIQYVQSNKQFLKDRVANTTTFEMKI